MKKEVAKYIAQCLECQRLKLEHINPATPSTFYTWMEVGCSGYWFHHKITKNKKISLLYYGGHGKSQLILYMFSLHLRNLKEAKIAKIYMKEISRLHGIPKEIVSDRDPKFTSKF